MKLILSILGAVVLVGCYATVDGQGQVTGGEADFRLVLPTVLPPLVVVEPGVSVVRDLDDEVFYADGYYYARQDQYWYRSRDHRSGWSRVEPRHVPAPVVQSPPGRYRHYHGSEHAQGEAGHGQHDGHDDGHH